MKKILFAAFMLMIAGGITYAQTTPAKPSTNQTPKKEAVKKDAKPVSSVTPAKTTTTPNQKTSTTTTNKTVSSSEMKKHKKHHATPKKNK